MKQLELKNAKKAEHDRGDHKKLDSECDLCEEEREAAAAGD